MSINRTRWLDKLRPAGASSGGWTEGPMAPVETTDAATVDQRCSFKHWTELSSLRRSHAFFTFKFPATRFVRVILEQGAMSSSQGKKKPNLCVSSLCRPYFRIVQKKLPISDLDCHSYAGVMQQYPESHHLCTEAVQQCPEEETPSSLRRGHATVSSGR